MYLFPSSRGGEFGFRMLSYSRKMFWNTTYPNGEFLLEEVQECD